MKIAISGKGGVGKTTVSALLCHALARRGRDVIAMDADSNPNLAFVLGVPGYEDITPLSDMDDLIEEKTGARKGNYGVYFKMNPEVADIPDRFKYTVDGIQVLVMGSVVHAASGCACPEYVLIKSLISYMLLNRSQDMIIDMEAGLEHLGRGVTEKVDALLIVLNPNKVSCLTAERIFGLAKELRIKNVFGVGNQLRDDSDREFILEQVRRFDMLTFFPSTPIIKHCERAGKDIFAIPDLSKVADELVDGLQKIAQP